MDGLGLQLFYLRNRGAQWVLCTVFGMTQSQVSNYLRFSRRILIKLLSKTNIAKTSVPDSTDIEKFVEAVSCRHPILGQKRVWGTMDGLKILLQQSTKFSIQLRFYNGWTHDHYVTNLFVFAPDGTIRFFCINCPGAVHDSQVGELSGLFQKLKTIYEKINATITVDSAFSSARYPFFIKSSESSQAITTEDFLLACEATSMRQSAEWGMRCLQGSFPRLKERFIYEERGERALMLRLVVLIYNYRVNTVGVNQIRNIYMPWLEEDSNTFYNL